MNSISVISTGNELIYGNINDTNSTFICHELFKTGCNVKFRITVGDEMENLECAFREAMDRTDIIIITGGLGPTDDDNTIRALKNILEFDTKHDQNSISNIEKFFSSVNMDVTESDLEMARIPENSVVLPNKNGLAPGFIISESGKRIIALPGVPHEMQAMFTESVIPFLNSIKGSARKNSFTLKIAGLKESEVNVSVNRLLSEFPLIKWGITAGNGIATVTFVSNESNIDSNGLKKSAEIIFEKNLLLPDFNYPYEELVYLLKKNKITVSTAESCTGGLISKILTEIPGSSEIFPGGVVTYSNDAKQKYLSVADETINKYGAVSENVAGEMAEGIRKGLNSDIGISVTGIAGPDGGTETKPVGTVCFGFSKKDKTLTFTKYFSGNRNRIRHLSSRFVIEYLRLLLRE